MFAGFCVAPACRRDPYRFLICADKFQTGYDEPLLHTMYVDKTLSGRPPHPTRPTPGPRKRARETIAQTPDATPPRTRPAAPDLRPRPLKAPEIHGKTRGCPKAIPEREHHQDWVAEGAVSSEPVSPRIWASARRVLNPRLCPRAQ